MHAMQFGNRGFGGPPQPQRQGGRRGNRGGGGPQGGFRNNSRFEHNQRNQNSHGGQRPNEFQQNKPQQQQQQTAKPQQQQQAAKPQQPQQPATPVQQSPQAKPVQQQAQQKPASLQQKPDTPAPTPQPQVKPAQTTPSKQETPKPQPQDIVDISSPEQKTQSQSNQQNQQNQQPKNVNGTFGGNKQGGWQGGPGNKQRENSFGQSGSNYNQGAGGKFGQGGQGMTQGGGKFGQNQGGNNQGGNRQFALKGGPGGPGGPARNQQGQKRGPHDLQGGKPMQREEQMLANKLKDLMGPLTDLQPIEQSEIKFNGRSRLYIGNLPNDVTEEEITTMFSQFGETAELFLNKDKMFGFIKMDYRLSAERAKRELDGKMQKGKTLRVRFAPHNSAIRVKNLPPFVSNELLYRAFEIFGKIERAYVRVDERGKTLGEGVVEFARKPSALAAIRNCTEKCFFLTSSLRPVIVENFEEPDELDGYPEKNLPKKHPEFIRAREVGPRFSELSSFEHEYGTRWKQLHELHKQKEDALKKELAAEEEKLEAQMEFARYEHETELLREKLRQREQEKELHKRTWEMAERAADERRDSERQQLLRQEEQLAARMRQQDDELRRRQQENTLFVQAQRLNSMLDRQEQGMFDQQQPLDGGFRDQYDMGRGNFEEQGGRGGWDGPRMDDYPNKRRRY